MSSVMWREGHKRVRKAPRLRPLQLGRTIPLPQVRGVRPCFLLSHTLNTCLCVHKSCGPITADLHSQKVIWPQIELITCGDWSRSGDDASDLYLTHSSSSGSLNRSCWCHSSSGHVIPTCTFCCGPSPDWRTSERVVWFECKHLQLST